MTLRLGDIAPNFQQESSEGKIDFYEFLGNHWGILFSHPADFTPVCTTELGFTAKLKDEFTKRGVKAIALSVDDVESHKSWIQDINETQNTTVNFPIIADLNMAVARAYGMVQPGASDTSAVRATFLIDLNGVLRAMLYYPMSNGRSVAEILRLVKALQTTDSNVCATPENWQPGDEVIVPPPATTQAAEARKDEGYNYVDWYFSKRPL